MAIFDDQTNDILLLLGSCLHRRSPFFMLKLYQLSLLRLIYFASKLFKNVWNTVFQLLVVLFFSRFFLVVWLLTCPIDFNLTHHLFAMFKRSWLIKIIQQTRYHGNITMIIFIKKKTTERIFFYTRYGLNHSYHIFFINSLFILMIACYKRVRLFVL